MSFLVFVSMTPLGKGESVSAYVAKVVDVIDRSGLPYVLTPMGTIVEGESWEEVMEVLRQGFEEDRLQGGQVRQDKGKGGICSEKTGKGGKEPQRLTFTAKRSSWCRTMPAAIR